MKDHLDITLTMNCSSWLIFRQSNEAYSIFVKDDEVIVSFTNEAFYWRLPQLVAFEVIHGFVCFCVDYDNLICVLVDGLETYHQSLLFFHFH